MFLLDLPTFLNSQKIPEVTPFVLIRGTRQVEKMLNSTSVKKTSEDIENDDCIYILCSNK